MREDFNLMAFSPLRGPVYGGDLMTIRLDIDQLAQTDVKYFVVFEGTRRRHVVSAHQPSSQSYLVTYIPGHDLAEDVQVTLVQLLGQEGAELCLPLVQDYFRYEYDSTFYLTRFLVSSVYNNHALDNLELIKSDRFDLSSEVLSTLDIRLSRSLRNANLTTSWHLLGGDSITDAHCEERETLLHLCARLGLQEVARYLLEQPGREDAIRLPNRRGELAHTIALENGFQELADMLAGFETEGVVPVEQEDVLELDGAVLRNYGNGTASLTSFLDSQTSERSIETEINFLKETEEMMKVQRGVLPLRNTQVDWTNSNLSINTGTSRSLPILPLEQEMKESLDRLLAQQALHRSHIQSFLRTSSLPVSDGAGSRSSNSFEEEGLQDITEGGGVGIHTPQASPARASYHVTSSLGDSEEAADGADQHYSVLECSRSGVRDLADSLFQLRDVHLHLRLSRNLRKRHFSRFSSSCPSLSDSVRPLTLSPIEEGDHHKSMHDLVDSLDARTETPGHQSTEGVLEGTLTSQANRGLQQEASFDQAIRICINGVTVDSSEDFPALSDSPFQVLRDGSGPPNRKYTKLGNGSDQVDGPVNRSSWSQASPGLRSSLPLDRRDQQTRVRMLAMSGKSLSLTSLEGEEESEDEDLSSQTETPRAIIMPRSIPVTAQDLDSQSESTLDSTGSSPGRELPALSSPSSLFYNAKSLTDLSSVTDSKAQQDDLVLHSSPAGSKLGMHHSFEESASLSVSSSMTKSLSTPSLPQATLASEERALGLRREGKHQDSGQPYTHKYLEDYDAQFRRQKEIEEEEDEDSASASDRKVELSDRDYVHDDHSPNDSDDKSMKGFKKEDKKRKPSVFSRLQSSYRTKKNKEKDVKQKDRHHFVSISFSNAAACDVCHKPMANKAALRCENCLVSVHEHNCKDQVIQCDRNKVLQHQGPPGHGTNVPIQSTHGPAPAEKQAATGLSGTSLRPSQSFKDKRSVSAPVKTQQQQQSQLSAPAQLSHRHSLPNSSKAISEESEADTVTTMDMLGQSNMTDTISESMESLDAMVPSEISWLDEEPDLQLSVEEPEAWSITVDRKTLKKLSTKDIKRQDTIWELINTEKQYVKRLKIMQKIFAQSMLRDMNFTEDQVDRLFPRLDDLVDLHANFLRALLLRQAQNEDRSVDDIGDLLVNQFQDSTADKMKSIYGVFCSKHTEAMQLYKELVRVDRKFQNYAKKCTNLPVCEKRDISDFILGVTVRLSKYPILIEAILKSTKDKKDRESLSHALLASKDVVQHIDEKVAAYERLMDIQGKMDSRAVMFRGKKFKRQELSSGTRELVYSGKIGWKSARGRVYDVLAVVLTDLIVFLQKNEQKYTFLMQDNKSCVIPLHNLLVREKRDAKDSLGIYMISQNRDSPEMYELVCQSKQEREEWIRILQEAIRACPQDTEQEFVPVITPAMALSNEEDKRKKEEHTSQVKTIIEKLHQKDEAIKECCDEKTKLMYELLELSSSKSQPTSRPNSQEIVNMSESVEVVHAAMQEASRLTTILQGSGSQLSRSVSSVGEHHSHTFIATPVPKRAETFAGFDSSHASPTISAMKQRFVSTGPEDDEGRSPSMLSLDQPEADSSFSDTPENTTKEAGQPESKSPAANSQSLPSPLQHGSNAHLWQEQAGSDRSSDRGSLGELSAASVSSLLPSPSNQEQMACIYQLVQYLNTLMSLTSKQCTKVESLRAELAEAKEEMAKLSADMHGRRSVYRHDQLEELRNLQENISREKQEWERTKQLDQQELEKERERLDLERSQLKIEKMDLQEKKEDFQREKKALQIQLQMLKAQGYQVSSSATDQSPDDPQLAAQQRVLSHRRSASADFYNTVAVSEVENIQTFPSVGEPRAFPRQPRLSVGNMQGQSPVTAAVSKQSGLPVHLLSARNEQRIGGVNVQHLPLKLSGSSSNQSPPHPGALSSAGAQMTGRTGSAGVSRVQSMSAPSRSALAQQENRHSAPSNLAKVMKLSDPKGKSSSGKPPIPPQSGVSPGSPSSPQSREEQKEDRKKEGVIYF